MILCHVEATVLGLRVYGFNDIHRLADIVMVYFKSSIESYAVYFDCRKVADHCHIGVYLIAIAIKGTTPLYLHGLWSSGGW